MPKAQTTPRNKERAALSRRLAISPEAALEASERILPTEELLERVPLDRSTLWRMAREGRFPKPIQLTPSRIGWRWTSVLAWLADREANPVEARSYFRQSKKTGTEAESR
jgi:prophage regulatory protein